MAITREGAESGTAVLLAAAPAGKGCLIDAASVLPALAVVAPSTLTGTAAATVIELADPLDPQTVLTRIRAAAATPGPLSLYLVGQLHLDHKQRLVHLALGRSTPATLRYTALPWHWLVSELKLRRPGTTTVVVDLVADAETWELLRTEGLALGYGARLYGRVVPPPPRRRTATPEYLAAYAAIWRSGLLPPLAQLHEQALTRSRSDDALVLAVDAGPVRSGPYADPGSARPGRPPTPPRPAPPVPSRGAGPAAGTDPHRAILEAAWAGRHAEAASITAMWESETLRAYGAGSVEAIHWLEVRADLARLAHDPGRSCELWMATARARLAVAQTPDDQDLEAAVDRAHHQWEQLSDPARIHELGLALTGLRRLVPGRRPGAVEAVQRRIGAVQSASASVSGADA